MTKKDGRENVVLKVVPDSGNGKLGPQWAVTYRPVGVTCPSDCPLLGNGCYAERGRVKIHASRSAVSRDVVELEGKLAGVARVRHLVSGDVMERGGRDGRGGRGRERVDKGFVRAVWEFHRRNPGVIGLMYTHAAERLEEAGFGAESVPGGLRVLASCDGVERARALRAMGWRTARVTETGKGEERPERGVEVWCPVDKAKAEGREVTTDCGRCGICYRTEKSVVFLKF